MLLLSQYIASIEYGYIAHCSYTPVLLIWYHTAAIEYGYISHSSYILLIP